MTTTYQPTPVVGPDGGRVPVDIGSATLSVTADGVEIKNDVGNPVPINDAGGSLTVDGPALTSIDGKLPALVGGKIPVDASVSITGGATEAKQDTQIAAVGAAADSAASSDTGTFSVIALIKRGLQNWTTLLGRIPSNLTVTSTRLLVDGSGVTQPVSGPLTDTQLRASAVSVAPNITRNTGAVDANTQRVTLATDGPGVANLASIAGLSIPAHDYIALSYTGTNLTGVVYKTGGSGGTTVGTLTLAYSGSNLTSVTKS